MARPEGLELHCCREVRPPEKPTAKHVDPRKLTPQFPAVILGGAKHKGILGMPLAFSALADSREKQMRWHRRAVGPQLPYILRLF